MTLSADIVSGVPETCARAFCHKRKIISFISREPKAVIPSNGLPLLFYSLLFAFRLVFLRLLLRHLMPVYILDPTRSKKKNSFRRINRLFLDAIRNNKNFSYFKNLLYLCSGIPKGVPLICLLILKKHYNNESKITCMAMFSPLSLLRL